MKLSLKKIFLALLLTAMISMLVLDSFTFYFNSRLAENQRYLIEATEIETLRYNMSDALSNFLARQEKIITAMDVLVFEKLPKQDTFSIHFLGNLGNLKKIGKKNQNIMKASQRLETAFQSFIKADQKLLELKKAVLISKLQLANQATLIDGEIVDIRNQADTINGMLALENTKIQNQVKANLQSPNLLSTVANQNKFKSQISQYLLNDIFNTQKMSQRLSTEVASLSALLRNIIESNDPDALIDFVNNQLVQLISAIKNDLKNLNEATSGNPDMHQYVLNMNDQFSTITDQINKKSDKNSIVELRETLNATIDKFLKNIIDIQKDYYDMSTQFRFLDYAVIGLKNKLLNQASMIAKENRIWITCIAIFILILIVVLGMILMRALTNSLSMLSNTMRKIASEEGNLSYRLEETHYEDLNEVSRSFNVMANKLDYIQSHLQELVQSKTKELNIANQNLEKDIARRIEIEKEVEALNKKLVVSARRAGMADVATSVLHNIGNILNSVNVSLVLLQEFEGKADITNLSMIVKMINDHLNNISQFLLEDEKGKLIPPYLSALVRTLEASHNEKNSEMSHLREQIRHIEDIVSTQQSISGVSNVAEKIFLPDLIEAALQLCDSSMQKNNITICKNFKDNPFIISDRTKLIQILVNLIQNAKDALTSKKYDIPDKIISITIEKNSDVDFKIVISDNGYGIQPENLTKIFSFGFTTKPKGHGFGLHGSALAAKELGGDLKATSDGMGSGATFTLILPATIKAEKSINVTTT